MLILWGWGAKLISILNLPKGIVGRHEGYSNKRHLFPCQILIDRSISNERLPPNKISFGSNPTKEDQIREEKSRFPMSGMKCGGMTIIERKKELVLSFSRLSEITV